MVDVRNAVQEMAYHVKVLVRGFGRVVYGTAVAGLFGLAAYGFLMIPEEGGYIAVCEFILAMATLVVALNGMYACGARHKKNGRFSYCE